MHGAWGWGEGSNGKHFSAIEGPGPGSVCVWGGGDVELFHCHKEGLKVWGGGCGNTLLP